MKVCQITYPTMFKRFPRIFPVSIGNNTPLISFIIETQMESLFTKPREMTTAGRDRSSETEVSGLEARSRRKSWRWRMVAPWNQGVIRWMVAKSESPVDRWFISWCLGFQPSKVMQDSFHQQYDWNDIYCWIWWNDAGLIQWILITMVYP